MWPSHFSSHCSCRFGIQVWEWLLVCHLVDCHTGDSLLIINPWNYSVVVGGIAVNFQLLLKHPCFTDVQQMNFSWVRMWLGFHVLPSFQKAIHARALRLLISLSLEAIIDPRKQKSSICWIFSPSSIRPSLHEVGVITSLFPILMSKPTLFATSLWDLTYSWVRDNWVEVPAPDIGIQSRCTKGICAQDLLSNFVLSKIK